MVTLPTLHSFNTLGHTFDLKYRSRKAATSSVYINKRNVSLAPSKDRVTMYPRSQLGKLGGILIKGMPCSHNPPLPLLLLSERGNYLTDLAFAHDCRLVQTRLGEYYLVVPCDHSHGGNDDADKSPVIALDPGAVPPPQQLRLLHVLGVRTFMTGYSPDGTVVELGKNAARRIERLCLHADKVESKIKNAPGKRRASLRRASLRIYRRIRNLIGDMHRKIVAYLASNYKLVLLPEFKASEMTKKGTRNIRSRTARQMLTLRHYSFRQRLQQKANASNDALQVLVRSYACRWG